jgi:hypothetical protein
MLCFGVLNESQDAEGKTMFIFTDPPEKIE